jgi:hypothetical protein
MASVVENFDNSVYIDVAMDSRDDLLDLDIKNYLRKVCFQKF